MRVQVNWRKSATHQNRLPSSSTPLSQIDNASRGEYSPGNGIATMSRLRIPRATKSRSGSTIVFCSIKSSDLPLLSCSRYCVLSGIPEEVNAARRPSQPKHTPHEEVDEAPLN